MICLIVVSIPPTASAIVVVVVVVAVVIIVVIIVIFAVIGCYCMRRLNLFFLEKILGLLVQQWIASAVLCYLPCQSYCHAAQMIG